jgi:hypothetical protein
LVRLSSPDLVYSLDLLSTSDPLLLLNDIELLIQISALPNASAFFKNTNIAQQMFNFLVGNDSLLVSAAIKFWGFLIFNQPAHATANIFDAFSDHFDDPRYQIDIVVALTNIVASIHGLAALITHSTLLQKVADRFPHVLGDSKIFFFVFFAELFNKDPSVDDSELLTEAVYDLLPFDMPKKIVESANTPISDLSVSALSVVKSLLCFKWGMQKVVANSSLQSFLLERSSSTPYPILRIKFEIAKLLIAQPTSHEILGAAFLSFKEYTESGIIPQSVAPIVATVTN